MKNEWSTYEYLNMGKIQFRASRCKKNKLFLENLQISNFDTVNIILSIWEFIQFLYMLLEV